MNRSSGLPLSLLRSLTVLNAVALAVVLAAVCVFGRQWPQALMQVFGISAGVGP